MASYLTALSWADLTYVLPATAVSYVLMALLGKFFLQKPSAFGVGWESRLSPAGVGFVAGGPALTQWTEAGVEHSQTTNSMRKTTSRGNWRQEGG